MPTAACTTAGNDRKQVETLTALPAGPSVVILRVNKQNVVVSDNGCSRVTSPGPCLWCWAAAAARNYVTPPSLLPLTPPVLCAKTGSASLLSGPAPNLTPGQPSGTTLNMVLRRGGSCFGCFQEDKLSLSSQRLRLRAAFWEYCCDAGGGWLMRIMAEGLTFT